MKVCRRVTFNAAHRIFNENWSDEKNLEVFGKCSYPNYHGHNYVLEVTVDGEINEDTGFVVDLKKLKDIINTEIIERFDHRNLNLDCIEFTGLKTSAENIAIVIYNLLKPKIDSNLKLSIRLWESENNSVEYDGK